MKQLIKILFILFILFSCTRIQTGKLIAENRVVDTIPAIKKTSNFNIDKILNESIPNIEKYADVDTLFYPLGNTVMEEDSSRIVIIGKFIDKKKVYALDISSPEKATLNFYSYENNKWKNIGIAKTKNDVYTVSFEDLDGDERNEIITSTGNNMNGNSWKEIYYCSKKEDTIKYAGNFSTDYSVNLLKKRIEVDYSGSWYMPYEKTIFEWKNEKLIRIKSVVRQLKIADMKHDAEYIEYYENPTQDRDTLILKLKKTYHENNKKLYNLWEHFFE